MTALAEWHGTVLAKSDRTVIVEGNHYFPLDDVNTSLLEKTETHTVCPWKGTASYYDVVVEGHAQCGRGVVLPDAQGCSQEHHRLPSLLEGCDSQRGLSSDQGVDRE